MVQASSRINTPRTKQRGSEGPVGGLRLEALLALGAPRGDLTLERGVVRAALLGPPRGAHH
jgi:hypothetical protein